MTAPRGRRVLAVVVFVFVFAACAWVWGRSTGTLSRATSTTILSVDTKQPGNAFDLGAIGLSIDANELGTNHLSATHTSLVRLMRLLGPSVLRIGGSSVDLSWWTSTGEPPPPWATNTVTPTDLVALRGLADATRWRVLLGVNLGHFEPARAADEARVAKQILGSKLLGVELGNEPEIYSDQNSKVILRHPIYGVDEYLSEVEAYRRAVAAEAPGLAVYGPGSGVRWLTQMGASASVFAELTEHYYPHVTCQVVPSLPSTTAISGPTSAELLSPILRQQENETLSALARTGGLAGRTTRIGETGTGPCGGSSFASPVFASALWSLDWALRAVDSGVIGLNFHGHLGVCGQSTQSPICAPTPQAANTGNVTPQPEYYGLLAASRLEGGRFVPTNLTTSEEIPNLTTWATLAPRGNITIAIDNLATVGPAQPVSIRMPGYTATEEMLAGSSAAARNDISLGGAPVSASGKWRPRRTRLSRAGRTFPVVVPSATAVIVMLRRDGPAS